MQSLACADEAGLHFIAMPYRHGQCLFYRGIPTIVKHRNPVEDCTQGGTHVQHMCGGHKFPWEESEASFYKYKQMIKVMMTNTYHSYIKHIYHHQNIDIHDANLSVSTFDEVIHGNRDIGGVVSYLPLIPSAALVIRCCDILTTARASDYKYGFLRWDVYQKLIPPESSFIYILSEPLDYTDYSSTCSKNTVACKRMGSELLQYLHHHFPQATVAIRRGYENDGLLQLSTAKTVICVPTTFCLFPAYINPGTVYLTRSKLVAGTDISEHVQWLYSELLFFTNFNITDDKVVDSMIMTLKSK